MYKIFLADNSSSGHHAAYLNSILELDNTENVSSLMKFSEKKYSFDYYLSRLIFLKKIKSNVNKLQSSINKGLVHLLYIDNLYTIPFANLSLDNVKVIGTLHHYPQNNLKMKLLKVFSKKIDLIIVHSSYIMKQLNKNGIYNVEVIHYPSFYNYDSLPSASNLRKELKISTEQTVFSLLGGTRYDKGLDIFLNSFQYIPNEYKEKILVNIVGKEETFDKNYIKEMSLKYNINIKSYFNFVTDNEFMSNVIVSDYMVVPYRNFFTGNSGPMTEAVVNSIPVIGPNYGNIGYLIKEYNLGYTFESENSYSLSQIIMEAVDKKVTIESNYKNKLTVKHFLNSYQDIYHNLM
ncbi:glycosyltransferase [Priestia flexa]|uniref:glycosyltransferase n=1 Tax=Priestia flexa TaxID=86664 RepID=UPI0024C063D2|nr:glycosyltransferase [Priestia flexa]WHX80026.1 glycosyltransferase [Priestia flexa]